MRFGAHLFLFEKFYISHKKSKTNFKNAKGEIFLKQYKIVLEPAAAKFYETLARRTGTLPEKIMAETLFKFAGELSVKAILENMHPEN